jgi:HPt (histidine-containing phosphotransfer) domain-containing protein
MTAYAMKGDRERCLEAGMDSYVAKPINSSQLLEAIDSVQCVELKASAGVQSPVSQEILDEATLRARFSGEPELLREVVNLYLENCPNLVDGIQGAVERGDARGLEWAAHKLKGTVANFAARAAYDAALHLEVMGRRGHLEQAAEALERLESALAELRPVLLNLSGGMKP